MARFGFLVPAVALFVLGGFYLFKASRAGFFDGRDRVRAVAGGLCYLASSLSFAAAFAQYAVGSLDLLSVAIFCALAGVAATPSGHLPHGA